jgi:hypothetical protein
MQNMYRDGLTYVCAYRPFRLKDRSVSTFSLLWPCTTTLFENEGFARRVNMSLLSCKPQGGATDPLWMRQFITEIFTLSPALGFYGDNSLQSSFQAHKDGFKM